MKLFIICTLNLLLMVATATMANSKEEAKLEPKNSLEEPPVSSGEETSILINPLGEETASSERHLYEPPAGGRSSRKEEQRLRAEPRNAQEELQQPASGPSEVTELSSLNQDFQQFMSTSTSTQSPVSSPASSGSTTTVQPQASNQVQPPAVGANYGSWSQQPPQQVLPAGNQQQQQQFSPQQNSNLPATSSLTASVQQPNSINAIINSNLEQPQQQQQPLQLLQQTQPQPMTMSVNGQPMLLVNSVNGFSQAGNGRRSISGWLKGISSMLANIFNRREHGNLLASGSSSPLGHWMPFGGANLGAHWLSQAQTALQLQQQQFQQQFNPNPLQAASTRFASYLQAPAQSASGQSQQPATMTITLQPASLAAAVPQAHQQPSVGFQPLQQQDLQSSGSSASYTQIQAPPGAHQPVVMLQQQYNPLAQQPQATKSELPEQPAKQWQPAANQTRFGRSSSVSANLPLAHYSRQEGQQAHNVD